MAAFTSPEADDRTNFEQRWARLRSDGSTTNRVVEIGGRVVGHIASFDLEGHREVTYWIGREDWGRGIATRALQEFLQLEATRPLYAHAASDNAASIRVLTKCGFLIVGEGREFAHGRGEETDEVVLRLDADPNCPRLGERSRLRPPRRLLAVCVRARSRRPNAPEMLSKHAQPHGYTVDSSVQRLGSRRAANAGNRAYAIVHKSVPKARRPADPHQ